MAKFKGKGVVVAGLVAGAASYLRKKENRDKVMDYINDARGKATEMFSSMSTNDGKDEESHLQNIAETPASSKPINIRENNMIAEGAQTAVHYYNDNDQEEVKS